MRVAVLGYGTVGSGVVEVIETNRKLIEKRIGEQAEVAYILDLRDFPEDPYADKVVHDVNIILEDASVDIVCETMGGIGAAYQFTKSCLERGKSVCTSNKELVAKHGPELLKLAKAHGCHYLFEASVGGGIPIIRPINEALTAERIVQIMGILNGTTNYILTKMEKEGANFDEVLAKAQELGYAERNPEADIEGHDACRKIAILSSLMMGKNVDSEKIYTEGITAITAEDFLYAKELGATIKLLGFSRAIDEDSVEVMVAPFLLRGEHPLSMVNDVFNAIFVTGNTLGDSMYYGRGAGKLATASAVVSDVIECARNKDREIPIFWDAEDVHLEDLGGIGRCFFVRAAAGAEEALQKAFPGGELVRVSGRKEDVGYLTAPVAEHDFEEKRKALGDAVFSRIRLA